MTLTEFLAWEERQEMRYEFDGIQPVAMTGGTVQHEVIGDTLRGLLRAALRGKPCRSLGPTMKIQTNDRIRYPDAFVYCMPVAANETVIRAPVVVFEVLSPGTSRIDRIEKLRDYQATASIRRYVILEQSSMAAMVFTRQGESWNAQALTGIDTLHMPEIEVDLPLADIYADTGLTPTDGVVATDPPSPEA